MHDKEIQEINSSKNKNDSVNFCSNYYTDDENNYKKNSQYLKDIEILNEINLEKSECEQYTNNHNISNQNPNESLGFAYAINLYLLSSIIIFRLYIKFVRVF